MSRAVALLYSRRAPQIAVLALMSIGFAGCSADMQSRLSENPFASNESTASVPPASVERRELPQYSRHQSQVQSQNLPPPISSPQSYPASSGVSGGGRGLSSYSPPSRPIETTGRVPHSVAAVHPAQGTKIIVGTSDTLEILARRYNVTPAAILQANGYKGPRVLSPGQQLIIPRPGAVAAAPAMSAPASRPVAASVAPASSVHVVNHGDTMMGIARRNHISVAELARANGLQPSAQLKLGMKLNVPVKASAFAAPVAQPAVVQAAPVSAPPSTRLAARRTAARHVLPRQLHRGSQARGQRA